MESIGKHGKTSNDATGTNDAGSRGTLDIAAATAREQLLETHVELALELIFLARSRVSPARMIKIYCRLHYLARDDENVLRDRVLAALDEPTRAPRPAAPADADPAAGTSHDETDYPWEPPRTRFGALWNRLRGRRQEDLRRWIELHTGRAEVALVNVHVQNALRFVDILNDEASFTEAIDRYLTRFDVRDSLTDIVSFFALDRLSDIHLPPHAAADDNPPPSATSDTDIREWRRGGDGGG